MMARAVLRATLCRDPIYEVRKVRIYVTSRAEKALFLGIPLLANSCYCPIS